MFDIILNGGGKVIEEFNFIGATSDEVIGFVGSKDNIVIVNKKDIAMTLEY